MIEKIKFTGCASHEKQNPIIDRHLISGAGSSAYPFDVTL